MTARDWQIAREELQKKLASLNEEIGSYPGPITGCDAQFNHLLEQRLRLNAELSRLDGFLAAKAGAKEFSDFRKSCPFLAGQSGDRK